MKKAQIQSIQRVIKELKKLRDKYVNDQNRYEVAENSAREQKEFWLAKANEIQDQIEAHEKTLPKEELEMNSIT